MLMCLHVSTSFVTFYSSQPHLRSFKNNKLTKSDGRRNKKNTHTHTENITVHQYSHSSIQNIDAMVFYSEHSLHRRLTNENCFFFSLIPINVVCYFFISISRCSEPLLNVLCTWLMNEYRFFFTCVFRLVHLTIDRYICFVSLMILSMLIYYKYIYRSMVSDIVRSIGNNGNDKIYCVCVCQEIINNQRNGKCFTNVSSDFVRMLK